MENDDNNDNQSTFVDASISDSTPPPFTCPDGQEISPPTPTPTLTPPLLDSAGPSGTSNEIFPSVKCHQNPRKKRTKLVKNIDEHGVKSGGGISKPKCARKPDPNAPKITRPCTECGKKFWSWKALFGHMRCHPEREWRGINPPPNFSSKHHQNEASTSGTKRNSYCMSEEDHGVAACLLMLANGYGLNAAAASESPTVSTACINVTSQATLMESENVVALMGCGDVDENASGPSINCSRFECSSCKKVFGSHQALGGHRASHKNVKGCFAITKNDGEEGDGIEEGEAKNAPVEEDRMLMVFGHKCSICLRVFSSGQALGGHKRCHWEKEDEPSGLTQGLNPFSSGKEGFSGLDLNLPAPVEDDDSSSSYTSGLALDLQLGFGRSCSSPN